MSRALRFASIAAPLPAGRGGGRSAVDTSATPARMGTFTVVKSTHATLTRSVRAAVAKWRFVPAEVSGCKVPRNFNGNWVAATGGSKAGEGDGKR